MQNLTYGNFTRIEPIDNNNHFTNQNAIINPGAKVILDERKDGSVFIIRAVESREDDRGTRSAWVTEYYRGGEVEAQADTPMYFIKEAALATVEKGIRVGNPELNHWHITQVGWGKNGSPKVNLHFVPPTRAPEIAANLRLV